MNDVKLAFAMNASLSEEAGPPPVPASGPLPPGWVRLPVTIEVMLPPEVAERLLAP